MNNKYHILRSRRLILAAAFCIPGFLAAAFADTAAQALPRPQPTQYEITSQMSEALRVLSTDPGRALDILRRLDRRFPGNDRVVSRLGYVYQVMGLADSAKVRYQQALDLNPKSLEAGKALGMLYLTDDKQREAMAVFDRLIAANGHNLGAYKTVGTALRDLGRYDEALQIYKQGRDRGMRHFVLTLEIADLYKTNKEYENALDEYLEFVGRRQENYQVVRIKILDMIRESSDTREELVALLRARLERPAVDRYVILDVLAVAYLEQGLLENALDMALLADQEKRSDGAVLLSLSDQVINQSEGLPRAQRGRYLNLGVRALDAFVKNHPRRAGIDRAKFLLATIYTRFGRGEVSGFPAAERTEYLEKAVDLYTEVSKRHAGTEYAELASLEKGDLLLRALKQPAGALEAYKIGAVNSRHHGDVFAARIAGVYLGQGDFDNAQHYFTALNRSGVTELEQAGVYYSGLLLALQGEYETARDTLTYLAEADPSSPYTNDAIETAWIIEEGLQDGNKSLRGFLKVMQAELLGDTVTMVEELKKIVSNSVYDVLRPRALFKLGVTLYQNGDLDGAVSLLQRFLDEYRSSSLRPDVQRTIASIYEFGYERYEKALREYEVVLMLYPDYAFLDEVRKDVRRLRFIVEGEE